MDSPTSRPPAAAQDPAEPFDVVLADGTPTGRTKPRAAVHRDGDWHRSVHVWVAGIDPAVGPFLLFQQRSPAKDTWGGFLDATVGGHFGAGEGLPEALREIKEEIGIDPDPAALRPLGVRVCANEAQPGILDRELQSVLLLRDDRPLADYQPNPAELAALARFPLEPLLQFLASADEAGSLVGDLRRAGDLGVVPASFGRAAFIPNVDNYFYRVAIAAAAALRGERHVAV
jgi:8-oxo-dGTP pyrophosphatase MutT (NUDIX family)